MVISAVPRGTWLVGDSEHLVDLGLGPVVPRALVVPYGLRHAVVSLDEDLGVRCRSWPFDMRVDGMMSTPDGFRLVTGMVDRTMLSSEGMSTQVDDGQLFLLDLNP